MCGWPRLLGALLLSSLGCRQHAPSTAGHIAAASPSSLKQNRRLDGNPTTNIPSGRTETGNWLGFDRNDYPGDSTMAALHKDFAFTGYWLTSPPGENVNTWAGKRSVLKDQGWGFLVLANGRLDTEILKAQKTGTPPADLGRKDASAAVSSAKAEGFPANTILFLDQEEGGRLLNEQAAYLLGWTEAIAIKGFLPGVYASGQVVEDAPGVTIDTVEDVRARILARHLHEVAVFDALDQCPPALGCTLHPKPLGALPDSRIVIWQYAQSPRRPEITKSCGATYATDGNCYSPHSPSVFLDMDVASSPDPSNGR